MTDTSPQPISEALAAAERADRELRAQVNQAAHARAHALGEVARLRTLAERPDTDAALSELADRYERQAAVLDEALTGFRGMVETQRATIERLRAELAGA